MSLMLSRVSSQCYKHCRRSSGGVQLVGPPRPNFSGDTEQPLRFLGFAVPLLGELYSDRMALKPMNPIMLHAFQRVYLPTLPDQFMKRSSGGGPD